jgi:hypothetical protein
LGFKNTTSVTKLIDYLTITKDIQFVILIHDNLTTRTQSTATMRLDQLEVLIRDPTYGGSEITLFGCGAAVGVSLWTLFVENDFTVGTHINHLLLTLLFLKVYSKEAILFSITGG